MQIYNKIIIFFPLEINLLLNRVITIAYNNSFSLYKTPNYNRFYIEKVIKIGKYAISQ